jgi:hypothetical protein
MSAALCHRTLGGCKGWVAGPGQARAAEGGGLLAGLYQGPSPSQNCASKVDGWLTTHQARRHVSSPCSDWFLTAGNNRPRQVQNDVAAMAQSKTNDVDGITVAQRSPP